MLGLSAAIRPAVLQYPNRAWVRFGSLLARIAQSTVMTLLFLLVFTPVGVVLRLAGKRPMRIFRDETRESYWEVRADPSPRESLSHQF